MSYSTTSSSTFSGSSGAQLAAGRRKVRFAAVLAGLALNLCYLLVVTKIAGYDLKVPEVMGQPAHSVDLPSVIGASLVAPLVGWGVLALLERVAPRRAAVIWGVLAIVVLIAGLPWAQPGITTGNRLLLGGMHLIVGLAVIPAFLRTSPAR